MIVHDVHERPLMTVPQTAQRLNVSEKTVRRLIEAELLPALRVGGSVRVDRGELEDWLYQDPGVPPSGAPDAPAVRRAPGDAWPAVEARPHVGEVR